MSALSDLKHSGKKLKVKYLTSVRTTEIINMKNKFLFLLLFAFTSCSNKKFFENTKSVTTSLFATSALCESITNYYSTIWSNAIQKEGSYYNSSSPYYLKEFNDAIVIARNEMNSSVKTVDSLYSSQKEKMRGLNDYPAKHKELHDEVLELYTITGQYVDLAKKPTGSLMSFNEDINNLSERISALYKKIEIQIPE